MNMFRQAVRSLTIKYLAVIMVLSLVFSFSLYQVAKREITDGLQAQYSDLYRRGIAFRQLPADFQYVLQSEIDSRDDRVRTNLIFFNMAVFVGGLVVSYLLARETLEPIEKAVEAQNRFTADASHELRTPLTSMRTEIEVALRAGKLTAAEAKQLLESNLEEVTHLESLVNGLLTLSRMPSGEVSGTFKKVDVRKIVNAAAEKFKQASAERNIPLAVTSGPAAYSSGDATSLQQLFTILIDNAFKYSPDKSRIDISISVETKKVTVKVTDQGIGIKATDIPHVFERFFRADNSRSKVSASGYGLGLSIARQIADLHKGSVQVDSQYDKGSTFTVTLPAFAKS